MQSHREQVVVRAATFAVVGASIALAAAMHTPSSLPSTAFGSALLLFFERLVLVAAGLLFLLVVLYRGWRGELPLKLSGRGAEWEPIVQRGDSIRDDLDGVQEWLDALREEVDVIQIKLEEIVPRRLR